MKKILSLLVLLFSSVAIAGSGTVSSPGGITSGGTVTSNNISLNDDIPLIFGSGADAACRWETADANANELVCAAPEGGATNVPGLLWGDVSISNADIGLFNGVNDPFIAVFSDDGTKAVTFSHDGTNGVIDVTSGAVSIPDGIETAKLIKFTGSTNFPNATSCLGVKSATGRLTINSTGAGTPIDFSYGMTTFYEMEFGSFHPRNNNGATLGVAGTGWGGLFLANNTGIDWGNGAATFTFDGTNFNFSQKAFFHSGASFDDQDLNAVGSIEASGNVSAAGVSIGALPVGPENLISHFHSQRISNVATNSIAAISCATYANITLSDNIAQGATIIATPDPSTSNNGFTDVNLSFVSAYLQAATTDHVIIRACNIQAVGAIDTDNDQEWQITAIEN